MVNVTSCRGRALMSASDRLSGLSTRPSTVEASRLLASMVGRSKCATLKNLSFGVIHESRSSQTSWVWITSGSGAGGRLVEPGNDDVARPGRKGRGRSGGGEGRQRGEGGAAVNENISAVKIKHDCITPLS